MHYFYDRKVILTAFTKILFFGGCSRIWSHKFNFIKIERQSCNTVVSLIFPLSIFTGKNGSNRDLKKKKKKTKIKYVVKKKNLE